MSKLIFPEILNQQNLDISIHVFEARSEVELREIELSQNLLSFIICGHKKYRINGDFKKVDANNFLLFPEGKHYMSEIPCSEKDRFETVLFFFSNEVIRETMLGIRKVQLKSVTNNLTYSFAKDAYISSFAESLKILALSNKKPNRQLLISKLKEFFFYVISSQEIIEVLSLIEYRHNFNEIAAVLEKELLSGKNIKEIAFACNMSSSTFRRKFLDYYGMSPGNWIKDKRLEHAAYLIRTGQKLSGEIYTECGYSSMSNFIRAFKQKFGRTPKEVKLRKAV